MQSYFIVLIEPKPQFEIEDENKIISIEELIYK